MSSTTTAVNPPKPGPKKNLMRSLRAALFGGSGKGKMTKTPLPRPAAAAANSISTIVGSARPLHVVDIGCSPERPGMASPAMSTSSGGSRSGMGSSYSSSQSLFDMDDVVEVGPTDVVDADVESFYDGVEGDEMIDAKAEEFIARFYQQVRVESR